MRPRLLGDRYRLGPVIGVGGMGTVHRARDERLGRDVAVKVLRAGAAAADCERLRREVEFLGSVHHPHLVTMLDGGADGSDRSDGVAWFAMELVAGPDLQTLLRDRGPLGGEAVRRLLAGVLGALAAMHEAGLVHRDVTPSNILLTADPFARWEAKLSDLGIARRVLSAPLTDVGRVVGTAAYLSPEQVLGMEVGPATDVYALALVAIEALTGRTPFPGSAVESATSRLLRAPAMPADLAPEWRELLRSATSVDPAARPTVAAFRDAALRLPDDAGVRPQAGGVKTSPSTGDEDARSTAAIGTVPVTSVSSAAPPLRTAVLRAVQGTTAELRAARTTELDAERPRRSRGRVAVVLTVAAAVAGFAIIGSTALIGVRVLTTASAAQHAAAPTYEPTPAPSASASASVDAVPQQDAAVQPGAPQQGADATQVDAPPGGPAGGAAEQGAGPGAGDPARPDAASAGSAGAAPDPGDGGAAGP